jgi:hypothetical protein
MNERFTYHIQSYKEQIHVFGNAFFHRLLPTYNKIEEETKDLIEKKYESLLDEYACTERDAGDIAQEAFDNGVDFHMAVTSMRQTTINLFAAGLHHLFEQQLRDLHDDFHHVYDEPTEQRQVTRWFKEKVSDPESVPLLKDLRLLANTVKHASGKSDRELRKRRPELFRPQWAEEAEGTLFFSRTTRRPLFGEDVYPTEEHLREFQNAVIQFWDQI